MNIHGKNILFLVLLPVVMYAYEARGEISAPNRELRVVLRYTLESDSVTLTLPQRARILVIQGSNQQTLPVYQNGNVLTFSKLQDSGRVIHLSYTIPSVAEEFFLEDWLPLCSEAGKITINTISPQGYRFLIFPYERRMSDGYVIDPSQKSRIIFGKYDVVDDSYQQRKISLFSHGKSQTDLSAVFAMIRTLETMLPPLQVKNIDLVVLPAWQGVVLPGPEQRVAFLGSTTPDTLKNAIVSLFFASVSNQSWRQALSDYYKRLLADDGSLQTDEGVRLPIPSDAYYQNVLKKGFPSAEKLYVDESSMEKNYVLLQFGFFTVPESRFHQAVRSLLSNPTNQTWDFAPLFEGTNERENIIVQWLLERFLPVPPYAPDLSVKIPYVYRNFTEVDVPARVDGTSISLAWNGSRMIALTNAAREVILDPERTIPQWNYANDLWIPAEEKAVWESVITTAQNHKVLPTDTTREILFLRRFSAPSENKWNLPAGTPVYVAITRVYTTYQGRMTVALKELLIAMNENRPSLLAYRLRL